MSRYNFKAPALPLPTLEYSTGQQNQFMNALRLYFNRLDAYNIQESTVPSGTTDNRPGSDLQVGQYYFATNLGYPIYWNGSDWVNAFGYPLIFVTGVQTTATIGSITVTTA
jgi:hypothetical protein